MKAFLSLALVLGISNAIAGDVEALKLKCLASDGSSFSIDQFQNDPCRIRKYKDGIEEEIVGVSLCLFPDYVRDSFSFWWFVPGKSKAELLGFLEPVGDYFLGNLSYKTSTTQALVSLECKLE